jgi:LmeA-like phospholipid-binding
VTEPWARPADGQPTPPPPAGEPTKELPQGYPPPEHYPPAPPSADDGGPPPDKASFFKRTFRDPLSIALVVIIVLALVTAGVVGGELYARHRANDLVATATACVVQDGATASFGNGLFLPQYFSGHYDNISISTAGNQIRQAKGMKAEINIHDVRHEDTADSKGTIGSLDATITWTADGIRQTVQSSVGDMATQIKAVVDDALNRIPFIGALLGNRISAETVAKSITIDTVTTNKSAGTIAVAFTFSGLAKGTVTVKPVVADEALSLQVSDVTLGGQPIPREILQDPLSAAIEKLTNNYPLGIKATSVAVTDTGVLAQFATKDAPIPLERANGCFAGL